MMQPLSVKNYPPYFAGRNRSARVPNVNQRDVLRYLSHHPNCTIEPAKGGYCIRDKESGRKTKLAAGKKGDVPLCDMSRLANTMGLSLKELKSRILQAH